ncbi:MAG: hypothetical protein WC625_06750 [Caldisericia bacterium]
MTLSESDTRAKLIDPALHERQWTEDLIKREESAGSVQIIDGKPVKEKKGRIDYTLRVRVNPSTQPVAVALIEAKGYDIKAVNPHAKVDVDTRTPAELLDLIEQKGKEVDEAIRKLRETLS